MKKQIIGFIAIFSLLALFTACNKNNIEEPIVDEEALVTAEDLATAQNLLQVSEDDAEAQIEYRSAGDPVEECLTITFANAPGTYPNTITLDYGTEGCEGPHGHVRKGKIIVEVTAALYTPGATRSLTFENFYIDEAQVEGTKTWENTSVQGDGIPSFTRTVNDARITFPDGTTLEWEANHNLTQIEGADTPTIFDNVFEITGLSSGTNRMGVSFSASVTTPLIKRKSCPWLVEGVWTLTNEDNGNTRILDYGDGTCDRKATVTLPNGNTRVILLHRWW